jgi:hypothetical protein
MTETLQHTHASEKLPLSVVLRILSSDLTRERISVGDLLAALGDRALAALMFVFAIPNVLPAPPGTSAILGIPLLFLAAQITFGRRPWLPVIISQRSIPRGCNLESLNNDGLANKHGRRGKGKPTG